MQNEMYSKYAREYDCAVQDNIYNAHYERPSLQAMVGDVDGKNVLDLGCGSGVYAKYLLDKGATVTSIDSSSEMIDIIKEKFGNKLKAYVQDLSIGLPKETSESFDIVICPLMVHYIDDLSYLFSDIRRVLKNDGFFFFSTHHPIVDFEFTISGNYFEREYVTDQWKTIDKLVDVSFYRRSLTELFNFITNNGMLVSQLSEGKPTKELKKISFKHYENLSKKPIFLFVKCQKCA